METDDEESEEATERGPKGGAKPRDPAGRTDTGEDNVPESGWDSTMTGRHLTTESVPTEQDFRV